MDDINTNLLNVMLPHSSLPSLTFLTSELHFHFAAVCLNPDDIESKSTTGNLIVSLLKKEWRARHEVAAQFFLYFFEMLEEHKGKCRVRTERKRSYLRVKTSTGE